MALDDLVSTESAVVAAATAAVFSPRTRETVRKGAVFGVAGALKAGDVAAGAARGMVRAVRNGSGADGASPARSRSQSSSSSSSRSRSRGSSRK